MDRRNEVNDKHSEFRLLPRRQPVVTDVDDLDRCLTEALASSGPALVDIAVDDATTDLFSDPR